MAKEGRGLQTGSERWSLETAIKGRILKAARSGGVWIQRSNLRTVESRVVKSVTTRVDAIAVQSEVTFFASLCRPSSLGSEPSLHAVLSQSGRRVNAVAMQY